jgi:hypothetical protein
MTLRSRRQQVVAARPGTAGRRLNRLAGVLQCFRINSTHRFYLLTGGWKNIWRPPLQRRSLFFKFDDFDHVLSVAVTCRTVTGEYSTIDDGTSQSEIIQTAEKLREDKAWGKVWTTRFNAFMASCVTRCTSLAGQTSTDSDHTGVKNQIPRVNMSMPPGPGGSGPLYH